MRAPAEFVFRLESTNVYRVSDHPFPLWIIPNPPARFNSLAGGATQYFSFHPLGAHPEVLHSLERKAGRPLEATDPEFGSFKQSYWVLRMEIEAVFDLTFESCSLLGLTPDDLVADDQLACRQAGDAFGHGDPEFPKAWRYPSASLEGTNNLVLFGARAMSSYLLPPEGKIEIPGSLAGTATKPPLEILPLMRHIGDTHQGLTAFRANQSHQFEQPLSFEPR